MLRASPAEQTPYEWGHGPHCMVPHHIYCDCTHQIKDVEQYFHELQLCGDALKLPKLPLPVANSGSKAEPEHLGMNLFPA